MVKDVVGTAIVVVVVGRGGNREAGTAGVWVDGSVVGAGGGAGCGGRLVACFVAGGGC